MLFYIAPSVADAIAKNDPDAIEFVVRLADSRKRGMLLLHASKSTFEKIIDGLKKSGNIKDAELILRISRRRHETQSLIKDLTKLVYISSYAKKPRIFNDKLIITSPKLINNTQFMYYPVVLAENVSDAVLYLSIIARHFESELPISLRNIDFKGRRRMGGGHTTNLQYQELKNEGLELCLCIVDSDRRCPTEKIGETAKLVVDGDRDNKTPGCDHFVIDVCAAENLLPIQEISRIYGKGKSAEQIAKFSVVEKIYEDNAWRYLPLKSGFSAEDAKGEKAHLQFWRERLIELGHDLACCGDEECECVLIPAVNSKTLAEAVKTENDQWYRHLKSGINAEVKNVYRKISLEIRSWCCVGDEMRT